MRLAIAGGGTGGHLFPGVAVAEDLLSRKEGHEVFFVGTDKGIEANEIPRLGLSLETVRTSGIVGKGLKGKMTGLAILPAAVMDSARILRARRPDAVLGVGGYASGPFTLIARLAGRPAAVLEQNSVPGRTNRILGKFVNRIFISYSETKMYFSGNKTMLTGTPVRADLLARFSAIAPKQGGPFTVFVFGGSQGARRVNEALIAGLPLLRDLSDGLFILIQTGPADFDRVRAALEQSGIRHEVRDFIRDMATAYSRADLVVCRAGAGTVSELGIAGKPSILVPYPFAYRNHQEHNARSLVEAGAARMIADKDFDGPAFAGQVREFCTNRAGLDAMAAAARSAGTPDAAHRIVEECLALAAGRAC